MKLSQSQREGSKGNQKATSLMSTYCEFSKAQADRIGSRICGEGAPRSRKAFQSSKITRKLVFPSPAKTQVYECGMETVGDTWVQFKVQYYIFALTFLVFADLPDIRDTRSFSPNSGSPDAQTRGSD
jgi:hypothetical protein